jgi:hypothetical protein
MFAFWFLSSLLICIELDEVYRRALYEGRDVFVESDNATLFDFVPPEILVRFIACVLF